MNKNNWTRLDNAALIYTSSLSNRYATKFRVSVTLDKEIDRDILSSALSNVIKRFPSFRYELRNGLYWWYFNTIQSTPIVNEACKLSPLPINDQNGYLFKISVDSKVLSMDVFHSLTDGNGAMTFLLTLAGEYVRMKEGVSISYNEWVLNPTEEASNEEVSDAFDSFTEGNGSLEKDSPAYHIKGSVEKHDVLNNVRVSLSSKDLTSWAHYLGCTVTDLVTSLMIKAIIRVRKEDKNPFKASNVRISVPVNLRKVFGVQTMRNFSSYVNLGVDASGQEYSLSEIIQQVSLQKKLQTLPRNLQTKVVANVKFENSLAIRCIPRVIKKPVMAMVFKLKGDKFCSHTLSNMGNIELPVQMQRFVTALDFQLGRQVGNSGAAGLVSYNGLTVINFSRKIQETKFERYFLEELFALGLKPKVEGYMDLSNVKVINQAISNASYSFRSSVKTITGTIAGSLLVPVSLAGVISRRLLSILGPFFLV